MKPIFVSLALPFVSRIESIVSMRRFGGVRAIALLISPLLVIGSAMAQDNAGTEPMPWQTVVQILPQIQTVNVGDTATFRAIATGVPPLTCQWFFNDAKILGATSGVLILSNVQPNQAGAYTARVTAGDGSTGSSRASLRIMTPLPSTNCVLAPSGIVGWWMGEGNANDAIGANNGTARNGASSGDGWVQRAFAFNGSNSFVEIPSSPVLQPKGPFTLEAWVNYIELTGMNGGTVVMKGPDMEVPADWTISISAQHKLRPHVNLNGTWYYFDCETTLQPQTWYHLALVYDGTQLRGYVNGTLDGTINVSGTVRTSDYPMKIGAYATRNTPWSTSFFDGRIDELSLYNRALSAAEIQAIYLAGRAGKCAPSAPPSTNSVPVPLGLVSWWRGENNAQDSKGPNHGIPQNGPTFVRAEVGNGFNFSGSNDCIKIPYATNLVPPTFTVEAWVKPSSQVSDPVNQDLIFGQSYGHGQLVVRGGTTGLRVAWQFGINRYVFPQAPGATEIPIGEFSHLVGTWDGATLRLYINGNLNVESTPGVTPIDSGCPFFIGGFYSPEPDDCSYVGQYFNGVIDEVSLYNRPLTGEEVLSLYNAGHSGKQFVPPSTNAPVQQTVESIAAPDPIVIQRLFDGLIRLSFKVLPGRAYRIQYTDSLANPDWHDLGMQTADDSGICTFTDSPPADAQTRFYRAIAP